MKKTRQEQDKIIRFQEQKKKAKKKSNKTIPVIRLTLLACLIVLIVTGIYIANCCTLKKMKIIGTQYYSAQDIKSKIQEDHFSNNTVILSLKNRFSPIQTMPFVDHVDIEITNANQVLITVHENLRAGCIHYLGKYIYFDKDGYALEVMDKRLKDVPLVTGLSYNNVVISEKLPVKKKGYFKKIIRITTLITKNELTINKIEFKEDGKIVLHKNRLKIALGIGEDLDDKLAVLPGIFHSLKGKKGTVHMEEYSKDNKIITFLPKK